MQGPAVSPVRYLRAGRLEVRVIWGIPTDSGFKLALGKVGGSFDQLVVDWKWTSLDTFMLGDGVIRQNTIPKLPFEFSVQVAEAGEYRLVLVGRNGIYTAEGSQAP